MKRMMSRSNAKLLVMVLVSLLCLNIAGNMAIGEDAQPPTTVAEVIEIANVETAVAPEATPDQPSEPTPSAEAVAPQEEPSTDLTVDQTITLETTPEARYTLTVKYLSESGELLPICSALPANPVTVQLTPGETYTAVLPVIEGYYCTLTNSTVTMGEMDETLVVYYYASIPQGESTQQDNEAKETATLDDHLEGVKLPNGPYVVIRCDQGSEVKLGTTVTLNAELHGFSGLKVQYQWQRFDGKNWVDVIGATGSRCVIQELNDEAFGDWRVMVEVAEA